MDEKTEKKQENTHNVLKNIVKGKKEALAKEEKKTKDEAKELIEQLQRIQAEFENYKKRTEKEKKKKVWFILLRRILAVSAVSVPSLCVHVSALQFPLASALELVPNG